MTAPSVETERLVLRPMDLEDQDRLVEILANPAVYEFLAMKEAPDKERCARMVRKYQRDWEQFGCGNWAVTLKGDPRLLGWCGLSMLDETHEIELLYMLEEESWGKGYSSEAARASVRFGFEEAGLERIIALCFEENIGSQKVMQKSGLRYLGKEDYFGFELMLHEILKKDYAAGEDFYLIHKA